MSGGRDDVVSRVTREVDLGIEGLSAPVLIGQGGFGAVYRAEQDALGRTVAVKILAAPGLDDRTRERFTRECMAIGALSAHPHIVTVFDSGVNGWGRPYIVMDYMARGSIADRVAVDGPMPWPEAVDMGIKICGAVASAHAVGILHRDIKPANVLISAYGEPKLGDFGISAIGGEQTSSGSITASLEHAAPELLDAATATTGTDVYALASTIYTMVAAEPPFPRGPEEPIQSVITRILTKPAPDLRPRGVPGGLCDVLERALAKSPDDRYASVAEFADALRGVQEQHGLVPTATMEAAPVGGFEGLDRFAPRPTGTTAPTRTRLRNEYVPPATAQAPTPVWKRPLFVAAIAVAFFAAAATAVAVTRDEPREDPAAEAVAIADETAPATSAVEPPRRENRDNEESRATDRRRQGAKKSGSKFARAGGGGAIPPPLPPSSGSSSGSVTRSSGSTSGDTSSRPNSGGGGKKQTKERQKPNYPPPPDRWLYHVWKGKVHDATIDPQSYPDDWNKQPVGLVYSHQEKGTDPDAIETEDGPYWAFAEQFGDTDPDVERSPLYKMTKEGEYFYVAGQAARDHWVYEWNWSASKAVGYVGR